MAFLLRSFLEEPTRDEISVVRRFWNADRYDAINETTTIIRRGGSLFSPQERGKYVNRAKKIYQELDGRPADYNYQHALVGLVNEFAGRKALPWLCDVIKSDPASLPNVLAASYFAMGYDLRLAAQAWIVNLTTQSATYVSHESMALTQIAPITHLLEPVQIQYVWQRSHDIVKKGREISDDQNPDTLFYKLAAEELGPVLPQLDRFMSRFLK